MMVFDPRNSYFTVEFPNVDIQTAIKCEAVLKNPQGLRILSVTGRRLDWWHIRPAPDANHENVFYAYLLRYRENGSPHLYCQAGGGVNRAKYFFTAELSGCTMAVGSRTQNGDVLVTHANSIDSDDRATQRRGQEVLINDVFISEGKRINFVYAGNKYQKPIPNRAERNINPEALTKSLFWGEWKTHRFTRNKWEFFQHTFYQNSEGNIKMIKRAKAVS